MKLSTNAIAICSFMLAIFVNAETLQGAFNDHFLMGTIWHGYKLGNVSRNRHVAKEKEITATEFNTITPENCYLVIYLWRNIVLDSLSTMMKMTIYKLPEKSSCRQAS